MGVIMAESAKKSGRPAGWSTDSFRELRKRAMEKAGRPTSPNAPGQSTSEDYLALLEELRIHQIEIEMQNEELRCAQGDLEASRARYFDLYDLAPVGYVTVDDQGVLLEMNLRATALLAVTYAALKLWNFSRAVAAEDQDAYYLCRKRLLNTGAPQVCELRIVRPNAPSFWARLEMSLGGASRDTRIVIADISECKGAELRAKESERQLRQQANAMPQIVWTAAAGGEVDYYNDRWREYTGYSMEKSKGRGWQAAVHPADLPACSIATGHGIAAGKAFEVQCRLQRCSDGAYRWHLARAVPYCDPHGKVLRWFGTYTDIHEQETAKERLEIEVLNRTSELRAKEDALRCSLNEKEVLLQEVHHRVKNNLQVISSLLRMQSGLMKDEQAVAALHESQQRVVSMALIHERLCASRQMDEIDFAEYTETLVSELLCFYIGSTGRVVGRLNTSSVFLGVDQAIPCGLILNELVTNALKYAYPQGQSGEVTVALSENAGLVRLSVSDQGVGLPEGLDWQNSDSMGLPIVDLLAKQLGGALSVRSSPGTACIVEFPKEGRKAYAAKA
jgi:PAS domain S-box-containing protein